MENKIEPKIKKIFNDVIIDKFKSNFEKIMKNLEILKIANPKPYEPYVPIYGKMHYLVDYEKMFCEFIELSKYAKSGQKSRNKRTKKLNILFILIKYYIDINIV